MILDLRDITETDYEDIGDLDGVLGATETALVLGLLLLTDAEMAAAVEAIFAWSRDLAGQHRVTLDDLRRRADADPALPPLWHALRSADGGE